MFRALLTIFLFQISALVAIEWEKEDCSVYYCPRHFEQWPDTCSQTSINSIRQYFNLIPRIFPADCQVCQKCNTLVSSSDKYTIVEQEEVYDSDTDEAYEVDICYCYPPEDYSCACCKRRYVNEDDEYSWTIYKDETWQGEHKCSEAFPKEWLKCTQKAWYEGYFSKYYHTQFPFFQHFLYYCSENKGCKCLWPELSYEAQTISNDVYSCLKEIIDQQLIDDDYLPFWNNGLNSHGKAVSIISHTFFYSQYHQSLLNVAKYMDQSFVMGETMGLSLIDGCITLIQPRFLNIYNQCLCRHPHPKIYYEKGMVLFHQGKIEESLDNVQTLMNHAKTHGQEELLTSEMYLQEGNAYVEACSYDEAIQALTRALKKDPLNKEALFQRSIAYFEKGLFNQSLDDYLASGLHDISGDQPTIKDTFIAARLSQAGLHSGMLKGGADGLVEFIPSTLASLHGLGSGLWAFTKHPIQASREFIGAVYACVEYAKAHSTQETIKIIVPELAHLINKWETIDDYKRGELVGYIIGKYGVDVFACAGIAKAVKLCRDLKRANTLLTLEAAATSIDKKNAIIQLALKKSALRQKAIRECRIHWDRQNKHIAGSHNFQADKGIVKISRSRLEQLLNKRAGTGQKVAGDVPYAAGYVERVDFGEIIGDFALKLENGEVQFTPTTKGVIKYSKDGMHVIPSNPKAIIK